MGSLRAPRHTGQSGRRTAPAGSDAGVTGVRVYSFFP